MRAAAALIWGTGRPGAGTAVERRVAMMVGGGPVRVGGAKQGGYACGERGGGAGSHGLDVGGVAEIEAAEAVGRVGGWAVDGGGLAGAAGSADPAGDGLVVALGVAASGSGEGVAGCRGCCSRRG